MPYNQEWYEGLVGMRVHSERAMWALLAYFGRPLSIADFGCGDGWMIRTARSAGVLYYTGIEADASVLKIAGGDLNIVIRDLSVPCYLGRVFDMVMSLEVGEHLPEHAANTYVDTLVRHMHSILVFSAAKVGQGGYEHINCQDQPYWRDKFERRGLQYHQVHTDNLRTIWQLCVGPLTWLPQNVQVFVLP